MVKKNVLDRLEDGQFNVCDLILKEPDETHEINL
jgi:hypothetical protein